MTDDEKIREYIRTRGVTRCPPGVASPTTFTPDPATRAFHAQRDLTETDSKFVKLHREKRARAATVASKKPNARAALKRNEV
jgi:hypothetical protein